MPLRFFTETNMSRKTNPFGKTATLANPYAIYEGGGFTWKVLKTYRRPDLELKNPQYARWLVYASSPACPDGEWGDTYAVDVLRYGSLVDCTDAWRDAYGG